MPVRVFSEKEKIEIKKKMFESGFELIKQYGLTHTSVSKITEAADIGKSTFYNFFSSKEEFVIELIKYERAYAMDYIRQILNGREKMSRDEAKDFLRMIIFDQHSIYQYLSEEDVQTLYPAMEKAGFISDDLNSGTPVYLLSIFEDVNPDVEPKIFVNFLRIMALSLSQKEALHQDVLKETLDMMFEKLFQYLFKEE